MNLTTSRRDFLALTLGSALLPMSTVSFAQNGNAIKLTNVKLFPDTPKAYLGNPLPGREFLAAQKRKLMVFYFDPRAAGQAIAVRVVGTKTSLGLEKQVMLIEKASIDKEGRVPLEVSYPRNWPLGMYRVEFLQGGKVVEQAEYRVKSESPRKTPITLQEIKIYRLKAGGGSEETGTPKARDHYLAFAAMTRGARSEGARVGWVLSAIDTTAGKKPGIGSVEIKDWPLDDTTLTFDMELPRDWPTGKYRVEVAVDGESIGSREFSILA